MGLKCVQRIFNSSIFQILSSATIGYILSSQALNTFSCGKFLPKQETIIHERTSYTLAFERELEDSLTSADEDEITEKEEETKELDQASQENYDTASVAIGCFILYDDETPSQAIFNTWVSQCDVGLSVNIKRPFPNSTANAKKNNSGSSLFELFKRHSTFVSGYNSTAREGKKELDFYVLAQFDTYVAVDNLKEYLNHCDPLQPLALGHALVDGRTKEGVLWYTVGGTLVLSKEAIARIMNEQDCKSNEIPTVAKLLGCLRSSGGHLLDSRDQFTKLTFLPPARPFEIITGSLNQQFLKSQKFSVSFCDNIDCLSDFPVAFHKLSASEIHLVHFLINWAHFGHYTGTNKYFKLRLYFIGSKLPVMPVIKNSTSLKI